MCECGKAPENPNHVFWQCARYTERRSLLEKELRTAGEFPPYCVEALVFRLKRRTVVPIAKFVKGIDRHI